VYRDVMQLSFVLCKLSQLIDILQHGGWIIQSHLHFMIGD